MLNATFTICAEAKSTKAKLPKAKFAEADSHIYARLLVRVLLGSFSFPLLTNGFCAHWHAGGWPSYWPPCWPPGWLGESQI